MRGMRLDHVLKLTDEAAHRTMDLVEQSGPLAERTARAASDLDGAVAALSRNARSQSKTSSAWCSDMDAFLDAARSDMDKVREQSLRGAAGAGLPGPLGPDHPRRDEARDRAGDRARRPRALWRRPARERRRDMSPDETRRGFGPPIPGINDVHRAVSGPAGRGCAALRTGRLRTPPLHGYPEPRRPGPRLPAPILVGAVLKGAGIKALLSAAAFMIVVVGTIAAICVQTPLTVMKHAMRILPWVFSPPLGGARRADQEDGRVEQHRAQAGPARPRVRSSKASPTISCARDCSWCRRQRAGR